MAKKRHADWDDPRDTKKFRKMNRAAQAAIHRYPTEKDLDIRFQYNTFVKGVPEYFMVIIGIIVSIGTAVYKSILKKEFSNIENIRATLLSMKDRLKSRLHDNQKSILFPEKGTYCGDLNDLDMETLYILIQVMCDIKPHSKGWGVFPKDTDRSTAANIDRVEIIRTKVGRQPNTTIQEVDFKRLSQTLVHATADLGADIQKLFSILHLSKFKAKETMEWNQTTQISGDNQPSRKQYDCVPALNQQEYNYIRIMRLTLDIGTSVLRKHFKKRYPFERSFGNLFASLKFRLSKILDSASRRILYPKEGKYTGDLSDLGIPTLYSILRYAGNIPPHRKKWGRPPMDDDRCLSANIERLRIIRNELMHYPNGEIDEKKYQITLQKLTQTLLELGANEVDIKAIIQLELSTARKKGQKKSSVEQTDESMIFWKKSSTHRTGWFFRLPIVCDGLVVDCIIDIRLEPNYKTLEKIIKTKELIRLSDINRPKIDLAVFYNRSKIEFEKMFIFHTNIHSSDVDVESELQNSVESKCFSLCRYILLKSNKSVICPLLSDILDRAINTRHTDTIKVVTSKIIKEFYQKHKEWFDKETSIWIGIECACETTKVEGYEDCLCFSSKPKIIIERYQSKFQDSTIEELFYSFSTKIIDFIQPKSTEASVVADNILKTPNARLIEGNIPGKIAKTLFKQHSNLSIIYPSSMKSKGFKNPGSHIIEELKCVNLICRVKGFVPVGETHFPLKIEGVPTDVLQGATRFLAINPQCRVGDMVTNTNNQSAGTLGGFVKYYGLNAFLTCAHVVFGNTRVHSITKEEIHHANCHMMSGINSSGTSECVLIRHVFKNNNINPSETSIDAALAVIKNGDISMFNIAEDGHGCLTCTQLGLKTPYLNHNAIDPVILRDARSFSAFSGNQKRTITAKQKPNILIRTPTHIQSGRITMYNQLCLYGMEFQHGDSGTCVYVDTGGNFNRQTGCVGMLIGKSTCGHIVLTPMKEILKIFDL